MILKIDTYTPKATDRFLLDTNVLLYLFCPTAANDPTKAAPYSNFLLRARQAGSELCFSALILSEFVNRYLRLDFEAFKVSNPTAIDFKRDFRPSTDYLTSVSELESAVKTYIYNLAIPLDDKFHLMGVGSLFADLENSDFNDNHCCAMAEAEGLIVVSEDRDWYVHRHRVNVLTANRWVLRQPS
jgi:predicted nucleic acid-binding protein